MEKQEEKKGNVIVEKVQKAADSVSEKVKEYNEKYLAKSIEKGKETLEKGKETLKEYNEKYIAKNIEKGKEYLEGPYKKVTEKMDEVLAKGRDMEKDALKKLDVIIINGKKFLYKLPMVETVEKKVTSSLQGIPGIINIPSKVDIEKLTTAMQSLNKNIESLQKHTSV